jgi:hypothetical protein
MQIVSHILQLCFWGSLLFGANLFFRLRKDFEEFFASPLFFQKNSQTVRFTEKDSLCFFKAVSAFGSQWKKDSSSDPSAYYRHQEQSGLGDFPDARHDQREHRLGGAPFKTV